MGAALLAVGIELLIGIGIGLIVTVVGLFFGNIIVFDSIALAILAGFLSHGLLGVHPALAVVIGIAVLLGLLLLHCTRPGFWLIGGVLSVVWGFIFATMAYEFSGKDMVWTYVVWALGAVLVFANMLFQSLGCSWRASFLAVCRQGLFFIPLIFLLPRLFDLTGLEMTQMVADFITFLCSGGMLLHFFRTELAREGEKSPAPVERKM